MIKRSRVLLAVGGAIAMGVCWANQAGDTSQAPEAGFASKAVRQVMRQASSSQDYELLARYFRAQERIYDARADSDREQWQQYQHTIAVPKFPAPADIAKWKETQDENNAVISANLAARYEKQLQASAGGVKTSATNAELSYTPVQRQLLAEIGALEKREKALSK